MSQITKSFVKFGCSNCFFLNTTNLICRSTDISNFFSGSLRFRDNESRLYFNLSSNVLIRDSSLVKTRMVVHRQLVEPAVCLSDLYDVFLLDIVRDSKQNLWTMIDRSQ